MWIVTKYNWERALLDYCKGEADLRSEAQELEKQGYRNLSLVARYRYRSSDTGSHPHLIGF
jgi:hypothetical protein